MGHDPWVLWVMGHVFDGSRGSWVTLYDPFAALGRVALKLRAAVTNFGPRATLKHHNNVGL